MAYLGIALFNVYALGLYLAGDLTLYIHPRYVLFTALLNAVSLALCATGFVLAARQMGGRGLLGSFRRPSAALVVAGLVLAAAYFLPARTLSSATADQRSDNFNGAQASSNASPDDTLALFGADTSRLTVTDWVSAFNVKTDPDFYADKKVEVVGFVFHPENAPQDVFYVSRFRVTCCTVDAQPVGLPVRAPGWRERFEADAWVRVAGGFAPPGPGIREPVVIDPENMEPVEQPENPYVT
jgi:putative membrane protein